jgi:hypothetical protein
MKLTSNSNPLVGKASQGGQRKGRAARALLAAGSVVGMLGVPAVQASAASPIVLTETSYYSSYASNGPIYNYMNTIFRGFEKTHPGIIIKREDLPPNGSYFTKIVDEAASNTLPDILMVDNPDRTWLAHFPAASGSAEDRGNPRLSSEIARSARGSTTEGPPFGIKVVWASGNALQSLRKSSLASKTQSPRKTS